MVYLDIKLIKINSRMRMKKQLFCEFLGILKDSHSFFDLCGHWEWGYADFADDADLDLLGWVFRRFRVFR